ncbi:MAG: 50S ribosomal protein L15 [Candidatus Jorgensenbacteria bacterium]|nr:50S ribosomal protein L15 [Candidatus Jorgensenbacteria bacterium]
MQLHELRSTYKRASRKRVGRGGAHGKTSGRGEKGQKARAGHRIRPAERDLLQRLPKLRGIKHPRLTPAAAIVTLLDLEKRFKGTEVTRDALTTQGFMVRPTDPVKVLGGGKLIRALRVVNVPVSESAKKAILAAGGTVE